MLSRVLSGAVLGVDAYQVRVEADIGRGLPSFSTVGLPQIAVREGKDRVVSAIRNSGFEFPPLRITINLAPADIRKDGSAFDLPIALGILVGTGQISRATVQGYAAVGELGLDGSLRPVRGVLPIAADARERKLKGLVVPIANEPEARLADGLPVLGARTLREVVEQLSSGGPLPPATRPALEEAAPDSPDLDFADVRGQAHARRAIEVAAAGAHNLLLMGPPGSGKTMLARRIPSILPKMSLEEALEVAKIQSVAGGIRAHGSLSRQPPFRAPHHTISDAGLVGGGSNPRPGEVSLAHNGVLFLDELPEFRRQVLEVLRQPLEDHHVTIARAGMSLTYPARFMLVAAMNPCPCGYLGDPSGRCICGHDQIRRYMRRVSGPLMDRIDLHVEAPAVTSEALQRFGQAESSTSILKRVVAARDRQRDRFRGTGSTMANGHMSQAELRQFCRLNRESRELLREAMNKLGLSARAFHRIIKLSRTIADLADVDEIRADQVAEAIQYRSLDRSGRT